MTRPLHGGRLLEAVRRHGIPPGEWLDLSCALNPDPWPVPALPSGIFSRLPDEDDGLQAAAAAYLGCDDVLMLPGTQAAISGIPRLAGKPRQVWVPATGYEEHAFCWQRAGHELKRYASLPAADALGPRDVVVCIRPNNPLGDCASRDQVLKLADALDAREGILIADEAFIDPTPDASLIGLHRPDALIVLRSFGKFFGLAGLRVGGMVASAPWRSALADSLDPWSLNAPARWIAAQAYADTAWQQAARHRLQAASQGLSEMLAGLPALNACPLHRTALFVTLDAGRERAASLHRVLASHGILTRLFAQEGLLRFGLPPGPGASQRLEAALRAWDPASAAD